MGFEAVWLFREFELDVDTSGAMTFALKTDLTENDLLSRYSTTFNTEATTTGRRTIRLQLPGNIKGRLEQIRISGASTMRLYGMRVWAKPLGGQVPWAWYAIEVVPTPDGYGAAKIPFIPSDIEWRWVDLPVDAVE